MGMEVKCCGALLCVDQMGEGLSVCFDLDTLQCQKGDVRRKQQADLLSGEKMKMTLAEDQPATGLLHSTPCVSYRLLDLAADS